MLTSDRRPALLLRQGLVLLLGAVVFAVLVGDDGSSFFWTPLGIGLAYLVAAVAGGRRGSYWAGALVPCGLLLAFSSQWSALTEARTYAPLADAVGLVNVARGALGSGHSRAA